MNYICNKCSSSMIKKRDTKKIFCKKCDISLTEQEYKEQAEQSRVQMLIDRSLNDLIQAESKLIPKKPNRTFAIGEEVDVYANWVNTVIVDIKDNFYCVEYTSTGRDQTKAKMWLRWNKIFKKNTAKNTILNERASSLSRRISFMNRQLEGIILHYYTWGIDFNPSYQRELCWKQEDKEKLIESILAFRDIGKIVLIKRTYTPNGYGYECLDGKQRLTTIIDFVEDGFTFKGLYYSEMSMSDKRAFSDYLVSYAEVDEDISEEDKIRYFLELNIAGVPQSVEHLEKVSEMLHDVLKKKDKPPIIERKKPILKQYSRSPHAYYSKPSEVLTVLKKVFKESDKKKKS